MEYVFTSQQQPMQQQKPPQQSTALSFPLANGAPHPPAPTLSPTSSDGVDLAALRSAATVVDRELAYDERRQEGLEQLETRDHGHYRYEKQQLTLTRQIALPQPILDAYDTVECQWYAGLLPAIQRAYVTADNRLFLFNYDDPTDCYEYSGLQQLIVSVSLIKPKPGIFAATVPYLLLLTTPVELHLLAVTFATASTSSALTLYPTAFSIASDGVTMMDVASTSSGRVFLGGKDGCVYELDYQPRDGWFRRKIRKVWIGGGSSLPFPVPSFLWTTAVDPIQRLAVDESRTPALLFALYSSSTIAVYSLGRDGDSPRLLSTHRTVWEESKELLYNLHPNSTEDWVNRADFSIIAIHPVPRTESERIVLTAVTSHGHRIYFTLGDSFYSTSLRVRLIRLSPPGLDEPDMRGGRGVNAFEPAWRRGRSPESVHFSLSRAGVTLMADSIPNAGDHLLSMTRDFAPTNKLVEAVDVHTLPSKVADLAETPSAAHSTSALAVCMYARGQSAPLVGLSEFASQHVVGPRVFVALTPVSVNLLSKRRAIDELCDVLMRRRRSLDDEELSVFFHRYGWKEAGAMLLTLACSVPSALALGDGRGVEERKESELFIISPAKFDHHPVPDDALIKQARQTFFRFAANVAGPLAASTVPLLPSPTLPTPSTGSLSYSLTPFVPSVAVSPSMSSLLLFVSRVLRPVWDWPITVTTSTPVAAQPTLALRYSPSQLSEMRGWLQRLCDFMEEHRRPLARFKEDSAVLEQLYSLLRITLELMSFLHLIATHSGVSALLAGLSVHDAAVLSQSKLYDLITSPSYLILKQLMLSSSTALSSAASPSSAWVQSLHEHAPTFFDHSDLLLYRAAQTLQRLRAVYDQRDREVVKEEAMGLYRMAARGASMSIGDVATALRDAGLYEGVVELALYRAELLARGEVTRGGTGQDEEEWAMAERNACYQVVLDTLNQLLFPLAPLADPSVVDVVLSVCLSSADTAFLGQLYAFLIQRDLKAVLFSHPSPHLPAFLGQHDRYALLLRDYFLVHRMHREACLHLHQLSMTRSSDYTLNDRVGFLTRALACAREAIEEGQGICGSAAEDSELCERLKDCIEVAKLQQKLKARLSSSRADLSDPALRDSVRRLDEELMDVEGLYLLAHSFSLWDVCLAIFYFSNERQRDDVIAALWRNTLRSEIAHHRAVAPQTAWEDALQEKMTEMTSLYGDVQFMFPLDVIVKECEFNEWRYGQRGGGVAEMLVRSGVDAMKLAAVYERVVGDAGWMEEGMELQVYDSVAWLLETLLSKRGTGAGGWGENMTLYGLCTRCQEALTTQPPTRQTEALARRLATVQHKISRMNG